VAQLLPAASSPKLTTRSPFLACVTRRLSYTKRSWELSVSAKRKFADGDVRARLSYGFRF